MIAHDSDIQHSGRLYTEFSFVGYLGGICVAITPAEGSEVGGEREGGEE